MTFTKLGQFLRCSFPSVPLSSCAIAENCRSREYLFGVGVYLTEAKGIDPGLELVLSDVKYRHSVLSQAYATLHAESA